MKFGKVCKSTNMEYLRRNTTESETTFIAVNSIVNKRAKLLFLLVTLLPHLQTLIWEGFVRAFLTTK